MDLEEEEKSYKECKIIVPDWLNSYECPFTWNLLAKKGLGAEQVILRSLEKIEELKIEEPKFSLQRFISMLKLVLEYYTVENIKKAWETMQTVEDLFEKEAAEEDEYYEQTKLPLSHVVSSTKACLLVLDNDEEKAHKVLKGVVPVVVMTDKEKAVLSAMKARFFLYSGYEKGEDLGVSNARKALELDPENPKWKYLLAKMLRQQRKSVLFSVEVPREELILMEGAIDQKRCSKFLVYLAQVYRECGSQAFKQYRNKPNFYNSDLHKAIEQMSVDALKYYKEALEEDPDSPAVLRRVGYGIMNLPRKHADYELALKCLLKSLELSDNLMTLHVLGTYYHRYGGDNKKAIEYFERTVQSKNNAGLSDMIRVKYQEDPKYDPRPDLEMGLSWELKIKDRLQILTQLAGYYLFIKRDFFKSIEYFRQVIDEDKDTMKVFKSFFLRMNEPINLYQYLVNEALLLIKKGDSKATPDEEEANCLANLGHVEDFVDIISEIHPELMDISPDPLLIDRLLETSKEIIEKQKGMKNALSRNFRGGNRGGRGGYFRNRDGTDNNHYRGRGNSHGRRGGPFRGRGNLSSDRNETHRDNFERRVRFSMSNQRTQDSSQENERGELLPEDDESNKDQNRYSRSNWRSQKHKTGQRNQNELNGNWRKK